MPLRTVASRVVVVVAVAVCLWALGVRSAAQQILRSGVNLVVVDMRVLSKNRQVADLRSEDVTLLVDGRARPIVSFEYIAVQQKARRPPEKTGSAASVTDSMHRLVVLIDRDSMAPNDRQPVRESARQFVERLPDEFLIAVAPLPLSRSVRFERDRLLVQQALTESFKGGVQRSLAMDEIGGFGCTAGKAKCGTDLSLPSDEDRRVRADNAASQLQLEQSAVLRDLRWLFTVLASTNEPTDVVIVNGGLPSLDRMRPELERVVGTARLGRVRVHTLRVGSLTQVVPIDDPSPDIDREGSKMAAAVPAPPKSYDLAARTGGLEMDRSASGKDFFKYLEQELAGSYLLGFEPLPTERDGRVHRIEIQIPGRSKVTVHARKEFVIGAGADTSSEPAGAEPVKAGTETNPPTAVLPLNRVASDLERVVARGSDYVERFERTFSTVVAEERYVQLVKEWHGMPPSPGDDPRLAWAPDSDRARAKRTADIIRRRQLLSDVLLVQAPGTMWIAYRDVAEVDRKAIRDRTERVRKLFLSDQAQDREQLQRIANESARHNLGTFRNINTPTFPLLVLRRSNVSRFSLMRFPDDRQDSECCAVVGFNEEARPTMVRTGTGRDLPMSGRLWIEERTGRVRRATLEFNQTPDQVRGVFDVRFRTAPGLDVLVPDRLWEWYLTRNPLDPGRQAYLEGEATYEKLRRFTVTTEEQVK
jgi:VWFA-related protein